MFKSPLHREMLRLTGICLLCLFLLPALGFWFIHHAQADIDQQYRQSLLSSLHHAKDMAEAERSQARALIEAVSPAATCGSSDPAVERYRSVVCAPYSVLWQFHWAGWLAGALLLGGGLLLMMMAALSGYAFRNRVAQYRSFVAGWRMMTWASVCEVVGQGLLAVWLSYWVTAYFANRISIKLIAVVGLVVVGWMFYAVFKIFVSRPWEATADGELVCEANAPKLWARIRELAAKLGTAPPDQMVAGIDCNFYVTEAPLTLNSGVLHGRTLFVSLPLLRIMAAEESDAVLAHELAHLSGGDTAASAALGTKLVAYEHYCSEMKDAGVFISVFPMLLFRMVFEFALQREHREREFRADRIAAEQTSPGALARALAKVAAYAHYRAETEQTLFDRREQMDQQVGIAASIAAGLGRYAASPAFLESMREANVPHPFDTHPPMSERVAQVGLLYRPEILADVVAESPRCTWVEDIATATQIEQRLWGEYESRFAAHHLHSLAYRYEPATEEEEALVLQYFPPCEFPHKNGLLAIDYAGVFHNGQRLPWDEIADIKYEDSWIGDRLTFRHPKGSSLGRKSTVVDLRGLGYTRQPLKDALGRYWQRHQMMRQAQAQPLAPAR